MIAGIWFALAVLLVFLMALSANVRDGSTGEAICALSTLLFIASNLVLSALAVGGVL